MNSDFNIAVHALVYLSHKACSLTSSELAENVCANPARVRKVLSSLKRAGLVEAKEGGAGGGYCIGRRALEITLEDVSDALEVCFVSTSWKSGDPHMDCLVASGMADIMDEIYSRLDRECKENLRSVTIADIEKKIFSRKGK